jgi:hypothetical protein
MSKIISLQHRIERMRCFVPWMVIARLRSAILFLFLTLLAQPPFSQAAQQNRDWDVSVWLEAETGEELLNDFSEAQMLTAGVFCGEDSYA